MQPNLCLFYGACRKLFRDNFRYRAFDRWDHGFCRQRLHRGSFVWP